MIDAGALLTDLRKQVKNLESDLRTNQDDIPRLRAEWEAARTSERTSATFASWLDERVTQVAVAWVLSTVLVRFCEDNGLIGDVFLAGPGERTALAREYQQAFFRVEGNRHQSDRAWLEEAFEQVSKPNGIGALFGSHSPMWSIAPSPWATRTLIDFWRTLDANGTLVHDFTDAEWNTRFLGDLYQDLSEQARKSYVLVQTPEFIEEFILSYTLDPAIKEFGLEPEPPYGHPELPQHLRVIDPVCGGGSFVLGAFRRLLDAWQAARPGTDRLELVARALGSVHGVDKNPFAVTITRFRLLLAAMKAADVTFLDQEAGFPRLNIAVGDSLLHGMGAPLWDMRDFSYATEDVDDFRRAPVALLSAGTYHVVVGDPPYITVKDKSENQNYRAYRSSSGSYALTVPFMERMFQLAIRGASPGDQAGYVGLLTSNSFMKREFGKRLIEEYLPSVDITHVIDTSGAYVPGHGTPTVILIGRRRFADSGSLVRSVLGIQGEPQMPENPEDGLVWRSIVDLIDFPGASNPWVSSEDLPRRFFFRHPWSLSGGQAESLRAIIEEAPDRLIRMLARPAGPASFSGQDDAFALGATWLRRHDVRPPLARKLVAGERLRDWVFAGGGEVLVPYDDHQRAVDFDISQPWAKMLWRVRKVLGSLSGFDGKSREDSVVPWWTWQRWVADRYSTSLSITFAEMATHTHFVLDRGGNAFGRTAPVIKLPEEASEQEHLALLAVLNSSIACFWFKQASQSRTGIDSGKGTQEEAWESLYQFSPSKVEQLPIPPFLSLESGRQLDALARELATAEPSAICARRVPTREALDAAHAAHERIHGRMIALQEELDWKMYDRYGLLGDREAAGLVADPATVPELRLGERAFEIVLARQMRDHSFQTRWFDQHGSTPICEVPDDWPTNYQAVVQRRIEVIERDRNIGLIERPEYKRRWQSESWDKKVAAALRDWLLDWCEARDLWFGSDGHPRSLTVSQLADFLRMDDDAVSIARLYGNDAALDLGEMLELLLAPEHVPYLAAFRYRPQGLIKRSQWEIDWDLQRQEDSTGERLDFPVPPKYTSGDFQKSSYWRQRGRLDMPKERFISYPGGSPDSDHSLLLGWAGWDHREQALALRRLIEERESADGWGTDRLAPLITGLAEVMPWVRQWHGEIDSNVGVSPAQALDAYLASQRQRHEEQT